MSSASPLARRPASTPGPAASAGALSTAGNAARWAVVGAGSGPDEFETKALVFISQHDEHAQQLLRELLALRSTTNTPPASSAVDIAQRAALLSKELGQESFAAVLHITLQIHGVDRCEEWWEGREWRLLRSGMVECVLNHVLGMREMLTEERGDFLRKVVTARTWSRVDRRFEDANSPPLREPDEEWRSQLNDWQALLRPYPWNLVRSQVMSHVLSYANLREPLTQHVRLVRSYEFLRCLGGTLLDGERKRSNQVSALRQHGRQVGCWNDSEVDEEALSSYLRNVISVSEAPASGEQEGRKEVVAQLGFTPRAVRGKRVPAAVLAHLVRRLLAQVSTELRDFCEQRGLRSTLQASEVLLDCAREALEQHRSTNHEKSEQAEPLREFLLAVSQDYIERTRSAGPTKTIDFTLLASGDPRMETLRALEEQVEARRLLDDMALYELQDLLQLVQEAYKMVHGDDQLHPSLELWCSRLGRQGGGPASLHPAEIGELSAALQDFLQQNRRALKVGEEDALLYCVVRALGRGSVSSSLPDQRGQGTKSGSAEHSTTGSALSHYAKPAQGAPRRVVACFGVVPGEARTAEGGPAQGRGRSPVVVRAVPLGLGGPGEDYEVRELGIRIGGMYRTVAARHPNDQSMLGDVAVVHYEWVPPGEVREDSKPLQQILASVTHVRIQLPALEGSGGSSRHATPEEREVDLQTNRVSGDSAWYRAIPSRPRTSADEHGGFRRLVLEVGRGLRLPLPNGLLQVPSGGGVIETADVLAHVLALWFSQKHARSDMTAALRQRPALLYFASTALFECFDSLAPSFMEALQRHWASVLGVGTEAPPGQPLSTVQQEAQEILLELLTARSDGRLCAVLPSAHLSEFCALAEKTRHSTEFLAVERFCFESALEKISAFQDSTITFIIIDITGQISALQLGDLVRHARGAIRLVFNWYHGLIPSLTVTRSLANVIVPTSIESDMSAQVSPSVYRENFAVGQATLHSARMMLQEPMHLTPLLGLALRQDGPQGQGGRLVDWARNLEAVHRHLREAHAWAQCEETWRCSLAPDAAPQLHEALLLLVAPDEALVRKHFEALPVSADVQCFDLQTTDRQALTQVEALLDRTAGSSHGDAAKGPSMGSRTTIVLFGVGFIPPSKLEDIVARAYLGGQRVVLCVQEPIAALRSVRVTTRHATEYVKAQVLEVTTPPALAPGVSSSSVAGLRALRLVLGHGAIASDKHPALRTALEAEDIMACTEILQPCLKPEVAGDLVAGVLHTLTVGSRAGPFEPRALAYAVGVLATSFVQRSSQLGLDQRVWDMSFPDFRAHVPVCRFLDQVSAVEAWCRYLDLVGSDADGHMSPRLPEGPVRWPRKAPHTHFILSQWIPAMNAHSVGLEDLLEHATPRDAPVDPQLEAQPPVMYFGTGPGHHSEAHEEVLERHSLQRRELDWAQFSESWRTALDIKPDVFLQLAAHGVDTLRLFLCLPPERAIELGLTHLLDAAGRGGTLQASLVATVAQKLLADVECTGPLLEAVVQEGAGEVAARLAAVKWLLLSVLPEKDALAMLSGVGRIDEATVEQLVQAKVMLCPRGREELLRRVVAIVVGLDGGDVLGTQHEIRRYLLETKTLLPELLCDQQAKVGRAIVSFMFSPDHAEQLKRREVGCAVVDGFEQMFGYSALHWRPLEKGEAVNPEPHRITASAHAAVLERAPGAEVAHALAGGPLLTAVSRLAAAEGAKSADVFLCTVLDRLPTSADTLVLAVLETLASTEPPASQVMARLETQPGKGPLRSAGNPFLPELFAALRVRSLGNYLALVAAHSPGDDGRPLQLALDGSPSLLSMYVEHFRNLAGSASEKSALHIHNVMLDDASCAEVFRYLVECGQGGEERSERDLFLLWYCWGRSPDRQLPFWALPRSQASAFTLAVNGGPTPFVERCRLIGQGLSLLAKYLIAPETLPLSVYNTLAHQAPWVHSEQGSAIELKLVLLGQEGHEEYPPYFYRVHARALPQTLRERLLRRCHETVGPNRSDYTKHHFFPCVDMGVSEQILCFNLGLLLILTQDNEDMATYFAGSDGQRMFLAASICIWCKAAGFSKDDLRGCMQPAFQERFERLWWEFQDAYKKEGVLCLQRAYVKGPLPAVLDVRWVDGNQTDVPIFARTRDSALLTAQWLNMLIVHFGLKQDLEPFTPEDLVRVSGPRGGGLVVGPRFEGALEAVSKAVGRALRRELAQDQYNKRLVRSVGDGKYDSLQLVMKIAVFSDFLSLLRSTPGSMAKCCEALTKALANDNDGPRPSDVHFGALFDAVFSLQTVHMKNEGAEVEELVVAYQKSGLPLSETTITEINWLHTSFFGISSKATQTVEPKMPHVPVFRTVCDRLHRIRHAYGPLKEVPFQRSTNVSTVTDVLKEEFPDPPYMKQLHFRLMCERQDSGLRSGATTSSSGEEPGASETALGASHDEEFFTTTGEEGGAPRGAGSTQRQWDRPEAAEVAWPDLSPVISAPDIVEIDADASFYLHATVRVRPGLQPILWRIDRTEGFYRLSGLLGQQRPRRDGDICKAFATNADAWQYLDRAQSAVVAFDGCYLRKADDGCTWVVVFPAARPPDEQPLSIGELTLRHRRYCIWPLCHSHRLVNLGFNSDTLQVVKLLVWVAWHMADAENADTGNDLRSSELSAAAPINIVEPLRALSVLSNDVERSVAAQVMPEGDEQLVGKMRRLHRYHSYERHLAEVLLRIMTKMKSQQRDDLGALIRSESQRRSATMRVPFVDSQGQELSGLGRVLQRLLVPIVSKAGIVGAPVTTKAWTQLELVLEACYRGEQLLRERCFAKHMHITKVKFAKRGAAILRGLYQSQHEGRRAPTVQLFSDSEDDEPARLGERPQAETAASDDAPRRVQYFEARSDLNYVDTAMDRDAAGGTALFDEQAGFGRPVNSRHAVLTFYDEDLPLYFVALNRERLKIQYSASEGMCLGYLVHKNVFAELLEDAKRNTAGSGGEDGLQMVRTLRIRLLPWIADVLRSPLPSETKTWILRCCERMGMVAVAPYQEANHRNLAVIAYCLCRCCPSSTEAALFLRSVLMNAWYIPADVRTFIERKSDVYGLYVVRPGTLQKMRDLGLHVAVRDFEREVWQRSMNNSAMYLDIISHFSSYCCFAYVQGLPKIDDIVLKWLAEYTRLHPWRFIFLEGVDTSFNFPENRDRCNFRYAPPNPLHTVKSIEDLRSPLVADIRPSHTIPYPERLQPSPEDMQDPKRLFQFFSREFAPADGDDSGQGLFQRVPATSHYSSDFRSELEYHLFSPDPCLVLLVSAPGAGKTHHMGMLRGRLEGEMQFDIHEFDGSSDILVTTALAEVLQRTISTQSKSGQKLLILDEYHMLSDEHKDELFEWVRAKLGPTLRVVLIGNRIDSKDRQRLEQSRPLAGGPQVRVALIQTRLSRQRIEQVMGARGNSEKWRDAVCDFLVGSRLVFGEESVSLRLCDTLEQALQRPDPRLTLVELLLHRVPTISRPTATEFVLAYLQHVGLRSQGSGAAAGLVGLCFRISMLDRQRDELCSFVEFLERTPRAHEALPAVRLLAWCLYMMNARSHWDISLAALWAKRRMFVDQVNFPFELGEESAGNPSTFGPTFSWAGDPTSLRDLVDAVKRGHSVDWADVHRKVWGVEHIKDSELFAQLLSSSRNPAMILQQVMSANLCSLLRLSNTPAPTAVQLARIILRHAPHQCEGTVDRPRCLALWTLVLHDRRLDNTLDVLRLVGGAQALFEALIWARDWATDRRVTVSPGPRARLLQQLLVLTCMQDQAPATPIQLALLWTGSFGRLLRAAVPQQEELWTRRLAEAGGGGLSAEFCARGEVPYMLPQGKFHMVLQRVADVQEDWAPEVQTLWRTAHGRSAAREISSLWTQAPYLLQDLAVSRSSAALTSLPVHSLYIPGIIAAHGTLARTLQRALLCNNCQVPEGVSVTAFVTSCADALNEMRNADQLKLVRVGGPNGDAIHRLVKEEMAN